MAEWFARNEPLTPSEMSSNAQLVYGYCHGKGWSINAICGMLGNMTLESGINPAAWQSYIVGSGGGGGFGLVQWTPWTNFTDWADAHGYEWEDGYAQLKWIDEETTNYGQWIPTTIWNFGWSAFKTSSLSPEDCASAFLKNFERAGVEKEQDRRTSARSWYNYLSSVEPDIPDVPNPDTPTPPTGRKHRLSKLLLFSVATDLD